MNTKWWGQTINLMVQQHIQGYPINVSGYIAWNCTGSVHSKKWSRGFLRTTNYCTRHKVQSRVPLGLSGLHTACGALGKPTVSPFSWEPKCLGFRKTRGFKKSLIPSGHSVLYQPLISQNAFEELHLKPTSQSRMDWRHVTPSTLYFLILPFFLYKTHCVHHRCRSLQDL